MSADRTPNASCWHCNGTGRHQGIFSSNPYWPLCAACDGTGKAHDPDVGLVSVGPDFIASAAAQAAEIARLRSELEQVKARAEKAEAALQQAMEAVAAICRRGPPATTQRQGRIG